MAGGGEMMETEPTSLNNNDNNKTVERKQQGCLKIRQQQQKPGDRLLPILPKPVSFFVVVISMIYTFKKL